MLFVGVFYIADALRPEGCIAVAVVFLPEAVRAEHLGRAWGVVRVG